MSGDGWHGRRARLVAGAVAVLLVLAGAVALAVGVRAQVHAPQPSGAGATSSPSAVAPASGSPASQPPGGQQQVPVTPVRLLPASVPTRVEIPAIGVASDLLHLGLNPDRTVQVPPLGRDPRAGWYRDSPTPGELGPSLILGHVDSAEYGPGIFYKLGALTPGQTVTVTRADRTAAVFRIDRVASFPKNSFPTLEVYGDTRNAQLRLITCGGTFDFSARSYEENIVVFASLVSSHRV
jgi:sortase (surface protein transpeptidase)